MCIIHSHFQIATVREKREERERERERTAERESYEAASGGE